MQDDSHLLWLQYLSLKVAHMVIMMAMTFLPLICIILSFIGLTDGETTTIFTKGFSLIITPYHTICFCASVLRHCFCTHLSRFAFLSLPLPPRSLPQDRSYASYLSHMAKGRVTSSGSAEHCATHWPPLILSSHCPGHSESHISVIS